MSRLSALLFLIPEEEEDELEDGKKKMNEEVEDGDKKKCVEEKNNCTTILRRPFGRHSTVFIYALFTRLYAIPLDPINSSYHSFSVSTLVLLTFVVPFLWESLTGKCHQLQSD